MPEVIRPSDCLMAMCSPTSKKGFYYNQRHVANNDFTIIFPWQLYKRQFVNTFKKIYPHLKFMKVNVRKNFTFTDFKNAIDKQVPVLILFAHWKSDQVEFYDGLRPIDEITAYIPASYQGIIDLCVCHPQPLVEKIVAKCSDCITRGKITKTIPIYWLHFYRTLMMHLDKNNCSYLEAFENTYYAFINKQDDC